MPWQVNHVGSLGCVFFTAEPVKNYAAAKTSDVNKYADYFRYMLHHGIYLAPAQFEAMFLSDAHTREDLENMLDVFQAYVMKTRKK